MIRIVIADDEPLVRQAVRRSLETEPDLDVVGEVANGREAVQRVESTHPDVVLLDYRMPVMDGLKAAREIAKASPQTRMVMMTGEAEGSVEAEATRAGVHRLVEKTEPPETILQSVREAMAADLEVVVQPEDAPDRAPGT